MVLETERNVATEGDIAKIASSRPSHGILRSFTVFTSCKSVSTTCYKSSITSTVTAEFKVQSE